jgi:hypothetical protein
MKTYILDGHTPVPCEDLTWWSWWFGTADRTVALTEQENIRVSTVFLGLDHAFRDDDRPQLFETMVFYSDKADDMDRYATWEEAEAGHAEMVRRVFSKHYQRVNP